MNAPTPGGVEDLVIRADLASRQSLLEVTTDAGDVLRSFGSLVAAAADLSTRMAHPWQGVDHSMAIGRLAEMTRAVVDHPWPGQIPQHPHITGPRQLDQAANLLLQAARSGPERLPAGDAQRVRARVLHTVYVASHAVDVALREEVPAQISRGEREVSAAVQAIRDRVSTIEHVAGAAVNGRPARSGAPEPAMSRLSSAFTEWDINTHRVLASSASSTTLEAVAVTQALATRASNTLIGAAAEVGHLPREDYRDRLGPALLETAQRWSTLRGELSEFTTARSLPPPELIESSHRLRAAVRDVVLDRGALASPATIADRLDVAQAAALARQSIGSGADLALMARELVRNGEQINAPAAAVNRKLKEYDAQLRPGTARGSLATELSVRDVTLGREVAVPPVLRRSMMHSAELLAEQSLGVLSAATGTWSPKATSPGLAIPGKNMQEPGRRQSERTPPFPGRADRSIGESATFTTSVRRP